MQFLRRIGLRLLFMLIVFVVRVVEGRVLRGQKMFGLTADRLFMWIIKSASGRSFICANVVLYGGLGVAIDRLRSWENVLNGNRSGLFLIRWMIGRIPLAPLVRGDMSRRRGRVRRTRGRVRRTFDTRFCFPLFPVPPYQGG